MGKLSRRSFIQTSAGVATGAVIAGTPAALVLDRSKKAAGTTGDPAPKVTQPSGPPPREPVMAYVRNEARGEVTVMSGTSETTYKDPALVKRLMQAAPDGESALAAGE